jgi:hypothetical protein
MGELKGIPNHFPVEVKNLIVETDEWVTEKDEAIFITAMLISKFNLTLQDYADKLKELRG